jgi:F0F1-type ATP synthase assembly protein I
LKAPPQDNPRQKLLRSYARYTGLGFQMLALIGLGTWGGIELDKRLDSRPAFTIALSLISVLLALGLVVREFLKKKKNGGGA